MCEDLHACLVAGLAGEGTIWRMAVGDWLRRTATIDANMVGTGAACCSCCVVEGYHVASLVVGSSVEC